MIMLIFVFLLMPYTIFGHDQERFLQAQQLYEQGFFKEAYEVYESIGKKAPAVLLAMGNCKYEEKEFSTALALWLRARLHADRLLCKSIDEQIAHLHAHGVVAYPVSSWYAWMSQFAHLFSLFGWQVVLLCLWYCIWLCTFFVRTRKWYACIPLVKLCLLAGICGGIRYYEQCGMYGVTRHLAVGLHVGPAADYQEHARIDNIRCVEILEENNKWYKIRTEKDVGWVADEVLQKV